MLRGKWWEIYQDPQLNQLEDRIAANNQSLRQALETYLAARDQVSAARADLFPTLSAGALRSAANKSPPTGRSASTGEPTTYNDFALGGQASWEPDFWGRIRRTVEAARANAQASAADVATVDLSLHAEMATDYFQLRGLDAADQAADSHRRRPGAATRPDPAPSGRRRRHRGRRGPGPHRSWKPCARNWSMWAWRAPSTNTPSAPSPTYKPLRLQHSALAA